MARKKLVTSHDIRKLRVVGGKKGTKRIGKVKSCVFHPTERRCIGFIVKRPDLLWMFHRKDIFVALDGFDFVDGRIRIKPDAPTSGHAICRAMGLDWDKCVLWEGLPIMTADETAVGFVSNITFDIETGQVEAVEASNGATAKLLLGTLEVPASYIAGFKHGVGADLAVKEDSREAGEEVVFKGAILVSDDAWELSPEGGWAEAAGKFTAKAGARARETAAAAKEAADAAKRKAYSIPAAGRLCEVPMEKEFVKLESAEGRICAGSIIPYPPGIPFVCPGEEITADIVRYIGALRDDGEKVIGVNDRGEVLVGR